MMMMTIMMLMMVMMMQGNACQLYPEVISFYSEPQHAIAWPKITINVANNNKIICLVLIFFGWIFIAFA